MAQWEAIDRKDLELFRYCSTPDEAFTFLREHLEAYHLRQTAGATLGESVF
jgi:hypothetical protein